MSASSGDTPNTFSGVDPDDAPELTDEWFEGADLMQGEKVLRRGKQRGRPRSDAPKELVSLRIDQDVLGGFRETGPGWQSRINAALREHLERQALQETGSVTVYHFVLGDIVQGENVVSRSKATAERIAELKGEKLSDTAEEVDPSELDGNGMYKPNRSRE